MSSINKVTSGRKVLVRNTENISVKGKGRVKMVRNDMGEMEPPPPSSNLQEPDLHSTKSILRQLRKVEAQAQCDRFNSSLNPSDKMGVNMKITRKMNFHIDDKVYKNLVALNIDDAEAKLSAKRSLSTPKYISKVTKDVEPNIQDFYQDELKIDRPIIPPSVKVKHKPIIKYNASDITGKMFSWETSW